jgi:hypothetical protein
VINASGGTQSIVIRGVGPTTGVTVLKGESALVAWNGSDFIKVSNTGGSASFTNVTVTGTTTLSGLTASTALALDASKNVVSVTNTGTGSNVLAVSPTLTGTIAGASLSLSSLTSGRVTFATTAGLLQDSANLTFDGTNLTLLGGTANGVTFLNGSKVLTSGSALTFDGTNLTAAAGGSSLRFTGTPGNKFIGQADALITGASSTDFGLQATNNIVFAAGGTTEGMRLTSTSLYTASAINVGIGTSSPVAKLAVSSSATDVTAINILNTSSGGGNFNIGAVGSAGWVGGSAGSLVIRDSFVGATRVVLDGAGNLGLGVTPSAWTGSYGIKGFNISNGAVYGATNDMNVLFNSYFDGTNFIYSTTAVATKYTQGPTGQHQWFNAASGTGGNPISFTQAMTLDASGNLGVGTTSPAQKLHVAGTIRATSGGATTSAVIVTQGYINGDISSSNFSIGNYGDSSSEMRIDTRGFTTFYTGATNNATGTERARIDSSGLFKIGTTSQLSAALLSVSGTQNGVTARVSVNSNSTFVGENASGTVTYNLTGSGQINAVFTSITAISDARLKTNIQTIKYGLDAVKALKPVMFDFIENDLVEGQSDNLGFIAQDVQSVIPELVSVGNNKAEDGSPYLTLKMGDMLPVLVKAIQEQQAIIESMRTEIDALKAKVGA